MQQCDLKNLSVLAYANGFTLWHYKSKAGDQVFERGFWSNIGATVINDDQVHVSGDTNAIGYMQNAGNNDVLLVQLISR